MRKVLAVLMRWGGDFVFIVFVYRMVDIGRLGVIIRKGLVCVCFGFGGEFGG